jgi:ketosteroid isomerase-like protein
MVSCQSRQTDSTAEKLSLEKARTDLISAMNSNDINAIMSALSSEHVTMAPNEPAYDDMEKLRRWHEFRVEHFDTEYQFNVVKTTYSDQYAMDYWMLETNSISKTENESTMGDNKGIWIWKRMEDGEWKLLWSIWNENIPSRQTEE